MEFLTKLRKKKTVVAEAHSNEIKKNCEVKESRSSAAYSDLLIKAESILQAYGNIGQVSTVDPLQKSTVSPNSAVEDKQGAISGLTMFENKKPLEELKEQALTQDPIEQLECPDCKSKELKEIASLPSRGSAKKRYACLMCDNVFNEEVDS